MSSILPDRVEVPHTPAGSDQVLVCSEQENHSVKATILSVYSELFYGITYAEHNKTENLYNQSASNVFKQDIDYVTKNGSGSDRELNHYFIGKCYKTGLDEVYPGIFIGNNEFQQITVHISNQGQIFISDLAKELRYLLYISDKLNISQQELKKGIVNLQFCYIPLDKYLNSSECDTRIIMYFPINISTETRSFKDIPCIIL